MKLKTLVFSCPPILNLAIYQNSLGVVDGAPSIYGQNYSEDFGLEDTNYPIFLPDNKIQVKIGPSNYTRIVESLSEEPSIKSYYKGFYREARLARIGFDAVVVDVRAPLQYLFMRIQEYQAEKLLSEASWGTISCWDSVRCEPADFESGAHTTQRVGVITKIESREGSGTYSPTDRRLCGGGVVDSTLLYNSGFTISFVEIEPRYMM